MTLCPLLSIKGMVNGEINIFFFYFCPHFFLFSPTTPGNPLANQPTSLGALVNCLMRANNKAIYGPQEIAQSTRITLNKAKITSSNLYLFSCADMLKKKKKPSMSILGCQIQPPVGQDSQFKNSNLCGLRRTYSFCF
jgi:hypothetical protein